MKLIQRAFLKYYSIKFNLISYISPAKAAKSAFTLFCTPYSRNKSFIIPEIFKVAERITFTFQHHTINGFRWRSNKKSLHKILICHGFDSHSYKFERYIEPLITEGFEVYAFDAPGHGISSGKTINALLYRDMILEVINKFGEFDVIMAHSFASIAVTLSLEKMKVNLPKRLILIAPATETIRSIIDFCRYVKISEKVRKELEKLILEIGGHPASWYSVARLIQLIPVSTLWVHDLYDPITPYADMEHLIELKLPHVQFVITEGLGHSLYKEDFVADCIMRFLKTIKPSD